MQESLKPKRRMIRKQVFVTVEQDRRLKTEAARLGVAEADLIRAGINLRLEQEKQKLDAWRTCLDELSGAWAERENLDEEMKEIRQRWNRRRQLLSRRTAKN